MATFDDILPEVRAHLPNVPDATLRREVRNAAIRFCAHSKAWEWEVVLGDLTKGQGYYELSIPAESRVEVLQRVWLDDDATPLKQVDHDKRLSVTSEGKPWGFTPYRGHAIHLVPTPDDSYTLKIRAALVPKRDSTTLDDWLADRYAEALAHGALARLYFLPGPDTFNGGLAQHHRNEFDRRTAEARVQAIHGYTEGSITLSVPPTFRGR